MEISDFDPNGIAINNGNFIGLPFTEKDAKLVLIPVPWDVTVSYAEGTATAPENIRMASLQLDLYQPEIIDAWKLGIYLKPTNEDWVELNNQLRPLSKEYISFLENGGELVNSNDMQETLGEINKACSELHQEVYLECRKTIKQGKIPAIVGGEHSVPLGLLKALSEKYESFGVLHIDAHMDLRSSYEGFTYSHASIFNNAINLGYVTDLVQVGIRDFCEEEQLFAIENNVKVFYDEELKSDLFKGQTWHAKCESIISQLPDLVYISFDIDGLNPHLCPNTGTPVPGGLEFAEVNYLIKQLVKSGRKIIGFDLCEVGGIDHEWDGNLGARILYNLCNWTGRSHGLI